MAIYMERIKKFIKENRYIVNFVLAPLILISLIYLPYKLSIYIIESRPLNPFLLYLSFIFGIFGILNFISIKLNNIIMIIYRQILIQKLLDNNGMFKDEKNRITYYKKISEFRKFSYWNHSIIIIITFLLLYPISKTFNHSYFLLIILFSSLILDYFLRKFSLEWAQKNNYKTSQSYSKRYWEKSYWEDFLSSFLQLFLTPVFIFTLFHFDIMLFDFSIIKLFFLIGYVLSFISFFAVIFYLLPVFSFLFPDNGKSRLEQVYEFYEDFLPDYY